MRVAHAIADARSPDANRGLINFSGRSKPYHEADASKHHQRELHGKSGHVSESIR
jgi:hypothetical protein